MSSFCVYQEESTAPSGRPSRSRIRPCSMWISAYPATESTGGTPGSSSEPRYSIEVSASRTLTPCRSVTSSISSRSMSPA